MRGRETKEEEGIGRRSSKAEAKTDIATTPSIEDKYLLSRQQQGLLQ